MNLSNRSEKTFHWKGPSQLWVENVFRARVTNLCEKLLLSMLGVVDGCTESGALDFV